MEKKTKKEERRPKKGDSLEVAISELNEDGFGLGAMDRGRILVSGALPGETVQAKVTFVGNRETFGAVHKILVPSPDRLRHPPCRKAAFCDGCPLISLRYESQLALKQRLVLREMHRYRSLTNTHVAEVIPSPKSLHYRNSAKLVIGGNFSNPTIGIYRRGSHEVIEIGDCPLHHPLINKVIAAVREGIRKGKVPIYHPRTGNGLLRYLVVRISETEGTAMAVFVTSRRSYNEILHLSRFVQAAVPEVQVVAQNVNASSGNVIMGEKTYFLTDKKFLVESLGETRFSISPHSFFQVNSGSARIIYGKVREWANLTGKESALDVYCGVGGISLYLAARAQEIVGIEFVDAAVADATKNARLNGIKNCIFEAGAAAELLGELQEEGKRFDVAVLNPPRKGCEGKVLESIAAVAPAKIIYVSCSPETLARDLDILSRLGYRTKEIQPVDMFPQTPHVENVALLERQARSETLS